MSRAKIFRVNHVKGIYLPYPTSTAEAWRPEIPNSPADADWYFFKLLSQEDEELNRFCPLKDWHLSGLKEPSFVDIGQSLPVKKPDLTSADYIGSISDRDSWILKHCIHQYYREYTGR
ncbi:hypothetical protein ACFQ22_09495 [Lentilactobacillus raoultii]|uniref:Uncharacterized protein n=1 Tax=Lentilactobacillus raoultii TaxID=1987503 RepID=A0ABW3PPT7_9LACO|nr:hypothetical protein [Lentilactobacillus raoultii]